MRVSALSTVFQDQQGPGPSLDTIGLLLVTGGQFASFQTDVPLATHSVSTWRQEFLQGHQISVLKTDHSRILFTI